MNNISLLSTHYDQAYAQYYWIIVRSILCLRLVMVDVGKKKQTCRTTLSMCRLKTPRSRISLHPPLSAAAYITLSPISIVNVRRRMFAHIFITHSLSNTYVLLNRAEHHVLLYPLVL